MAREKNELLQTNQFKNSYVAMTMAMTKPAIGSTCYGYAKWPVPWCTQHRRLANGFSYAHTHTHIRVEINVLKKTLTRARARTQAHIDNGVFFPALFLCFK